jgi:hypothetical protein
MRWTRRNHRKLLKALALSLATSAVVAGAASAAQVHDGGSMVTPTFEPITSVAQQYGGTAELPAAQQGTAQGVSSPDGYQPQLRSDGQLVMRSNPDGYQPQLRGDEQLVIRDRPDGFQPQTKQADVVSVSASSSSFPDSSDLALGFGLGLILATAAAIALAMVRDPERMAHS